MIKKITFLLVALSCTFLSAQTTINDFETGSLAPIDTGGGSTVEVVVNPSKTGLNTSDNVLKLGRTATSTQWWAYTGINVDHDVTIAATDVKFLSIMVNFPAQPDLAIRLAATTDGTVGPGGTKVLRALNKYTDLGNWQEIIFEIRDDTSASGTSFTSGTIFRVDLHPDVGGQNDPVGRVLSDTVFGYVDNIKILDSNPLSVNSFSLDKEISIYPNLVKTNFEVKTNINIKNVSLYNLLGKEVTKNVTKLSNNKYDISNLSSGMYIAKITDDKGSFITKKLIKE